MHFRANGKLLLTSEYFILDGAQAISLPTKLGQTMDIHPCESPILKWDSFHDNNTPWISALFDIENFDVIEGDAPLLQKLLRRARALNPNFLKSESGACVTTHLQFPNDWGLGSSSTLIHLIAQWAGIDTFELQDTTLRGSGYDIACADSKKPILYKRANDKPTWQAIDFNPSFSDSLYLIHLNKKQDTRDGIAHYQNIEMDKSDTIQILNDLSQQILTLKNLNDFESILATHEDIIATALNITPVQQKLFPDYWGQIKSLGAWGGDFVLATSDRDSEETFAYFITRGYNTLLKYKDIIL